MLQDQPWDGHGYWPALPWQLNTTASQQTISLCTDESGIGPVVLASGLSHCGSCGLAVARSSHVPVLLVSGLTEIRGSSGIIADGLEI